MSKLKSKSNGTLYWDKKDFYNDLKVQKQLKQLKEIICDEKRN